MSKVLITHGIGCLGVQVDGLPLIDGKTGRPLLFRTSMASRTLIDPRDGSVINRIVMTMAHPDTCLRVVG